MLHDGGEIHGLRHVDGLPIGPRQPLELAHHPRHEVLGVVRAQRVPGAHPPAGAERHHPDLPAPRDVHAAPLAAVGGSRLVNEVAGGGDGQEVVAAVGVQGRQR